MYSFFVTIVRRCMLVGEAWILGDGKPIPDFLQPVKGWALCIEQTGLAETPYRKRSPLEE